MPRYTNDGRAGAIPDAAAPFWRANCAGSKNTTAPGSDLAWRRTPHARRTPAAPEAPNDEAGTCPTDHDSDFAAAVGHCGLNRKGSVVVRWIGGGSVAITHVTEESLTAWREPFNLSRSEAVPVFWEAGLSRP